ncbi:MAG: DUF4870 domain-containing protein [Chthoniobacterales bacterium]|nr:DUF4870 domain-containing protein [Chthoniobacterales bacterium]
MENTPPPVPSPSNQPSEAPLTAPASSTPPPVPTREDQSWAIALHLSGFAGFLVPSLGQILAPLVIWLIKRPESPYLDRIGKEVLNFQISYTIYGAVAFALCWLCIGFLVLPVVVILWIVYMIMAAVKTSNGQDYQYPFTIRFLQ